MWHTHIVGHSPANVCEPYGKLWTVADVSVLGCNSLVSHCTCLPGMGCRGQGGTPAVVEGKECGGTLYFPFTSAVSLQLLFLKSFLKKEVLIHQQG